MEQMYGFFIASGPNIKPGISLGPIRNIIIYSLMTAILGLENPEKLESDFTTLSAVLKRTNKEP